MPPDVVTTDWKLRHPFTVGMRVWAKSWSAAAGAVPPEGRVVWMRGESERGLWIAFAGMAYEFPADDFTAVAPMSPADDVSALTGSGPSGPEPASPARGRGENAEVA